jgi:GGDEF domain-containing protein
MSQPELHSVVHSYLTTLLALSEAVGEACPEVGEPHQQRLGRLRTRLSFDSNPAAVEASTALVRAELRDFARKSADHIELHTSQWKEAARQIRAMGEHLVQRQRYYGSRVGDLATKLDSAQGAQLLSVAESIHNEGQSMLARMQQLIATVEARLAAAEVVDPVTGLMNLGEWQRRLELIEASGNPVVQLLFLVECDGRDELIEATLRQIAMRLTAQLRPEDLITRSGDSNFLVLFQSTMEVATRRGPQIAALISGTYTLDSSAKVDVRAAAMVLQREMAEMAE